MGAPLAWVAPFLASVFLACGCERSRPGSEDADLATAGARQTEERDAGSAPGTDSGKAFLARNAEQDGVITTASGLQYEILVEGNGQTPGETDRVTVHYTGTLIDGAVFDSSVEQGQPAELPVNRLIPGWVEALQLMQVGDKWRLFIPSDLAYGERGAGDVIGPHQTLIFEVELLDVRSGG